MVITFNTTESSSRGRYLNYIHKICGGDVNFFSQMVWNFNCRTNWILFHHHISLDFQPLKCQVYLCNTWLYRSNLHATHFVHCQTCPDMSILYGLCTSANVEDMVVSVLGLDSVHCDLGELPPAWFCLQEDRSTVQGKDRPVHHRVGTRKA